MTMTDIENLLIAALPSLTAILTILVTAIKFIGKFTNTDTHIRENLDKLKESKEITDEEVKRLKAKIDVLLDDNKKLKKQLAELLTDLTKIYHKPEE